MLFEVPENWEPEDWTKFTAPESQSEVTDLIEGIDWSLILAFESCEIPERSMQNLIRERSDYSGIDNGETLISPGPTPDSWALNLETLWKLYYEHRRYAYARGFSDTEMDVLRAIEFADSDRVSIEEIKESNWLEGDPSESTIYKALNGLIEKDLIERAAQNNYRYIGPLDGR